LALEATRRSRPLKACSVLVVPVVATQRRARGCEQGNAEGPEQPHQRDADRCSDSPRRRGGRGRYPVNKPHAAAHLSRHARSPRRPDSNQLAAWWCRVRLGTVERSAPLARGGARGGAVGAPREFAKGLGWTRSGCATDPPSLLDNVGREVGQVNVFSRLEGNSHKMSSQIEQTGPRRARCN
jgi:hypothetical protein